MKASEKKWISILAIVAIIVIVLAVVLRNRNTTEERGRQGQVQSQTQGNTKVGEYTKLNSKNEIVNVSEKVNKTKEVENLELTNVTLKEAKGETTLKARITNKGKTKQEGFFGNIVLIDKSNKEIGRIPVKVSNIEPTEATDIEASITESYADAYDYRLEK